MVKDLDFMKESLYNMSLIYRENKQIVSVLDSIIDRCENIIVLPRIEYGRKDIKSLVHLGECHVVDIIDNYETNEVKAEFIGKVFNETLPGVIKTILNHKNLPVVVLVNEVDYDVFLKEYYYIALDKLNDLIDNAELKKIEKEIIISNKLDVNEKTNRNEIECLGIGEELYLSNHTLSLIAELEAVYKSNYEEKYIDKLLSENRLEELKLYMQNKAKLESIK